MLCCFVELACIHLSEVRNNPTCGYLTHSPLEFTKVYACSFSPLESSKLYAQCLYRRGVELCSCFQACFDVLRVHLVPLSCYRCHVTSFGILACKLRMASPTSNITQCNFECWRIPTPICIHQ